MGSEVTPEPIDFDFFAEDDEDIRSGRNSAHRSSPQVTTKGRPVSASSGRSAGSSRSSLSVKIPSAGPTGVRENAYNAKSRYSDSSDEDNYAGKESRNRHGNKAEINRNAVIKENGNRPNVRPRSSGSEGTEGVSRKMPASSRPKTSKGPHTRKRHESSSSNESRSLKSRHSSSSSSSESGHSDSYTSVSDSDSDVTDVSPLPSPARSPIPRLEYDQDEFEDSFEESRFRQAKDQSSSVNNRDGKHNVNRSRKKETVRFSGVTPSIGPTSQRDKKFDETEARELSRLLRAVLELEETPNCSQLNSFHKSTMKQRPWSAKRAATAMPHQRVNLSFSNDKVRQIDRENQRLLHKILHRPKSAVSESGMASMRKRDDPPKMMSHSAIRRQREQRKIDMENRRILQRIESTRACSTVERTTLLHEHETQMKYASQVSKGTVRPTSSKYAGFSHSGSLSKGSSLASLSSDISRTSTASTGSRRTRPSSGRSMPPPPRGPKQAWDERW